MRDATQDRDKQKTTSGGPRYGHNALARYELEKIPLIGVDEADAT
jgi:hypothetical protein